MTEQMPPIVVNGGKCKKKQIKALRRGEGRLAREVAAAVAEAREQLGEDAEGKVLVPVAVVYRRKRKRPSLPLWWLR
jgi:hypothetical protein